MEILKKTRTVWHRCRMAAGGKGRFRQELSETLASETEERIEKGKQRAAKQLSEIRILAEAVRAGMKEKEQALIGIKDAIALAAADRDREQLIDLLLEEEQTENAYLAHKRLYDNAVCDAIKIRDGYRLFESEMRKKQQETRSLRTRLQRVRLQEQIVQLDSRYTAGAEKEEALRSLRKAVQEKCTMAESRAAEQTDLISRNSSRKKAIEKAEALLTVGKESEAAQQSG